jgi:hypothetical protein
MELLERREISALDIEIFKGEKITISTGNLSGAGLTPAMEK